MRIDHPVFTATASGTIAITFAAATAVRSGIPVLRITPTVTVSTKIEMVQIAWWLAMLLGEGGITGLLVPVLEGIFRG